MIKTAKAFDFRLSEFIILTKTGPLSSTIYEDQLNKYVIEQITIKRIDQEVLEKEFPRYLIS